MEPCLLLLMLAFMPPKKVCIRQKLIFIHSSIYAAFSIAASVWASCLCPTQMLLTISTLKTIAWALILESVHFKPGSRMAGIEQVKKTEFLDMQVIRLCRQHRLTTALAYLFPRALLDYVAPVAELVIAIAKAKAEEQEAVAQGSLSERKASRALGFKLLVYLRTNFAGLTFPPGKGFEYAKCS